VFWLLKGYYAVQLPPTESGADEVITLTAVTLMAVALPRALLPFVEKVAAASTPSYTTASEMTRDAGGSAVNNGYAPPLNLAIGQARRRSR